MANVDPELPVLTNLIIECQVWHDHVWHMLSIMDIFSQRRPITFPHIELWPSVSNKGDTCPIYCQVRQTLGSHVRFCHIWHTISRMNEKI